MVPRTQLAFFCGIVVGCHLAASSRMVSNRTELPRRRGTPEETGNPTKDTSITDNSKPTSIQNQITLQRNEMVAINFADQSRLYQHDPVFLSMPVQPLQVDPRFITEHTGLKVPAWADCSYAFTNHNNAYWGDPTMVAILGGIDYLKSPPAHLTHNYYYSVPSRWRDCHNLQSYIMSGQKWFIPEYPIVDEEYIELVSVYQMALKAKRTFTMVEIGARWGSWGYRAAAAIRKYNQDVEKVNLLFMEPSQLSCAAIREVAEANDFKMPMFDISVRCEAFGSSGEASADSKDSEANFRAWAESKPVIDVFDIGCQGCEYTMLEKIGDVLNSKVRRVIIGDHKTGNANSAIMNLLKGWVHFHTSPMVVGDCQQILRGPFKWQAQSDLVQKSCTTAPNFNYGYKFGPMINWDGDIILDNPKFIEAK